VEGDPPDRGRHVRIPAPVIDQLVQLPALIRQCPRAERLLDRGTLLHGQGPVGLLPRPIGGLLGGGGGIVWAYRHPLPEPPGGFPCHTRRVEAWASHSRRTPSGPRCDDAGRYGARNRGKDERPAPPVFAPSSGLRHPTNTACARGPVVSPHCTASSPITVVKRRPATQRPLRCGGMSTPQGSAPHRWGMLSPPPFSQQGSFG
jgi:hypothetical protein